MSYVFGKTIHEARKNKGLTLEELANEIESSKGYISGIETSTRRPPSDKIVNKLAKVLGLNRKMLTRMAHIDKIPEDIKEELRVSTIIAPKKISERMGQDITSLLKTSSTGGKKKHVFSPSAGPVPIIVCTDEEFPSGFEDVKALEKEAQELAQFNIPGLQVSFALRMPDISMERKRGISFDKESLVFFASVKKIAPEDCVFVVYRSEKGLCSTFRCVKSCTRSRIHLISLNSRFRKEIILPRQIIEKTWKAVANLRLIH